MNQLLRAMLILVAVISFTACKKNPFPFPGSNKIDIDFYGLTDDNAIVKINGKSPGQSGAAVPITGLPSGEKLLAIDFRPATGQLYALGNSSRLYVINYTTGTAIVVGMEAFTPALNGTMVGFDFNPTVDRIRVVTTSGQNLRLNPETGMVAATDGNLNPGTPMVTAAAYTNSYAGASTTILYTIDATAAKLYNQDPPNDGTLVEIGSLHEELSGEGGFDISADNKYALAAFSSNNKYGSKQILYTVDLGSGKLSRVGELDKKIIGLAIPGNPVAYAADMANNLHIFDPSKPFFTVTKPFSGLQTGEKIIGMDMRPATGQLFALGSTNRIYAVNMASGVSTPISATPFAQVMPGVSYGFDFNPTVDRIRVIGSNGQNLRLHPMTGAIAAMDANLNPGTPMVSAAAYTNSFAGATATVLFDIDHMTNKLYKQDPPNDSKLVEVGSLNVDIDAPNGFDIGGTSNKAYALLSSGNNTKLYMIDLMTGNATATGSFPEKATAFTIGLGF